MKVFLDCNVFMDFYAGRSCCEEAAAIFQAAQQGRIEAVTSIICVSDIVYLFEKYKILPRKMIPDAVRDLTSLVGVLSVGASHLDEVLAMPLIRDLEDALEMVCAQSNGCEVIVTINKKDFQCSTIPVMTPGEFLKYGKIGK